MKKMPLIIIVNLLLLFTTHLLAQKNVKVRFEEVQEKCKGLTQDKKVRIAVARFNVTTPNRGGEFGENMATMLTNALQQTNCYMVLAQLKNLGDLKGEINFNKSDDANGENGPEKGKMSSAQIVVTGEITEYSVQKKSVGAGPFKTNNSVAKIGFIVQIINPETRQIISSQSVNVEGKVSGSAAVGVRVPIFGTINAGSGSNDDPAVANALEKGIIEAVEYLAGKKEELAVSFPPNAVQVSTDKLTVVIINNTDFSFLSSLSESLKNIPGVNDIQKTLSNGVGTLKIKHTGTTDSLLNEIANKQGNKVEVTDFSEGKITLKVK